MFQVGLVEIRCWSTFSTTLCLENLDHPAPIIGSAPLVRFFSINFGDLSTAYVMFFVPPNLHWHSLHSGTFSWKQVEYIDGFV
jgi:hypothetical protein